MQRCSVVCLFSLILLAGCGQKQDGPPQVQQPSTIVVIVQQPPNTDGNQPPKVDPVEPNGPKLNPPEVKTDPLPMGLSSQQRYDESVSRAFQLLAEKKEEEALAAFQQAQDAQPSEFVKGEIERLKLRIAREATVDRTVQDIKTVLASGRAVEAAKLASDALEQFGDSDAAEDLTQLKRQADALIATQIEEKKDKQRFMEEAEAARKAKNYRAALLAYDQAVANSVDVVDYREYYDALRTRISRYDEQRARAAELRRDVNKMDEAIVALEEARKAWDTPQIVQEIDEARLALQNRRERLAVADFEVVGDVGIPLAGRAIADDLLPHFKSRFDLVERGQIANLVAELKLNPNEIQFNEQGRSEIGRLAKARYMVVGSVSNLYGLTVNARLVDVQTGLIVQTGKIVAGTPRELVAKMKGLASILMMSDEEKILYEADLARAATIAPPVVVEIAPPPAPPIANEVIQPIVVYTPRPPEYGVIVIDDYGRILPPPPQPSVVVILETTPCRPRAVLVALELGDNLYRRGMYREAMRHFEFALSLSPGHGDIRFRIDRCRPHLPPPIVVIVPPRPRLGVLPFAEIGPAGFVPHGTGIWTAEAIAPYFASHYDVIDSGEVFWWMGRLGLSLRDVLIDPSARLCLARAMGVRFFLMGNLRYTASFDATAQLVDAEFNALIGSGAVHVHSRNELKMRLGELTRLTTLPPEQRAVLVKQSVAVEREVQAAQIQFNNGKFSIAVGIFKDVLKTRPDSVQIRFQLLEAERRQRQFEMEEARRQAFEREQARHRAEQQRQLALAAEAERQRLEAERHAAAHAEAERRALANRQQQAQVQLVFQARNAAKNRNFTIAINLFESAHAMNRTPEVANELAQVRAQAAEAERQRIAQAQTAQNAALAQQRQQQIEQARITLETEQQRRAQEELARRKMEEAQSATAYQQLLDQADQAKAKGQFDVAVSALQGARQLKPSVEIDRLVTAALIEQARAEAAKKGDEEKKKLEAALALEQERSRKAEAAAAENKAKYETAIGLARTAMKQRKFAEAKQQFQVASQTLQTDEAVNGLKQADNELATAQAAMVAEEQTKIAEKKKADQLLGLIADARKSAEAKQFDKALQLLKSATTLDPTSVEAQSEIIKIRQAREDHLAFLRKQKDDVEKQTAFQKLLDAGKSNIAAKQYDAAIVSLNDALKMKPGDPTTLAALKDAQAKQNAMLGDAQAIAEAKKKRDAFEGHMQRGRTAMNLKNWDAALEAFKAAQSTLPGDTASAQFIKEAEKAKADADSTNAARLKTAALAQAIDRARSAIKLNKFDDATTAIADASKIDPANAEVKKVQQELSDARNAFAATQKMAALQKAFDASVADIRAAVAAKKFDDADKALAQAKQLMPSDPAIAKLQQEISEGRRTQAANMNSALEQAKFEQAVNAGRMALNAKKYAEAVQQFTVALKVKPDRMVDGLLTQARSGMAAEELQAKRLMAYNDAIKAAETALASGKYDDALKSANQALQMAPNDPTASQLVKRIDKAKTDAASTMAEAERRKNYDAAMTRGRQAMQQKQFALAATAFTEALKFAPNDSVATRALAEARDALNPPKKEMPKTDPNLAAYNQSILAARAAFAGKRYEEAIRFATEALKYKANDGEATKIVSDSRSALTPPKVDPPKKEPPKTDPNLAAYNQSILAARAAFAGKRYEEAIRLATEALKYKANDAEATKIVSDSRSALTPPKVDPPKKEPPRTDPNQAAYNQNIIAARAAFAAKHYEEAIKLATEALKYKANDGEATKIVNDSRTALNPPKKETPKVDLQQQINLLLKSASGSESQSKYDDAQRFYQEALKLAPGNPELKKKIDFCKGMAESIVDLRAGRFGEAIIGFDLASKMYPNDANAKRYLQMAKDKKKQ